jgi:hypothetical protein
MYTRDAYKHGATQTLPMEEETIGNAQPANFGIDLKG